MSVITAIELDDLVAPCKPAREPDARHRRLSAAVHHPHFFDRRHPLTDQFRQFHFERIRNSKTQAARGRLAHRIDYHLRRMPKDRRSPTADVIDVFVSIDIPNLRSLSACDEEWLAIDVAKRAHR